MAPIQGRNQVSAKTVKGGVARRVVLSVTALAVVPQPRCRLHRRPQIRPVSWSRFSCSGSTTTTGTCSRPRIPARVTSPARSRAVASTSPRSCQQLRARQEVQPHRRCRRPHRGLAVPVGRCSTTSRRRVAERDGPRRRRASATTSSTRASPSSCACRTAAATPSTGVTSPVPRSPGANFQWLAANIVNDATGKTLSPSVLDPELRGAKIAFIGMTLEAHRHARRPAGDRGLELPGRGATAQRARPRAAGGKTSRRSSCSSTRAEPTPLRAINGCDRHHGPIVGCQPLSIPRRRRHQRPHAPAVQLHDRRSIVTSAFSFGRVVTEVNLVLDKGTNDVRRDLSTSINHAVIRSRARTRIPRSPRSSTSGSRSATRSATRRSAASPRTSRARSRR